MSPVALLHDNPLPLYRQIEHILRDKILKGEWSSNRRLPSEDELTVHFNVSKITVRQALARLANQRLVVRRPGKGTFVTGESELLEPPPLVGALDDLSALDARTSLKVLHWGAESARGVVARALQIRPGTKVATSRRVRFDAEGPISYVETFLPEDIVRKVSEKDFVETLVIHLLERRLGLPIDEARQTTAAAAVDATIANHLQIRVGTPVLRVERVFFGVDRRSLCFMVLTFRADRYRYTVSYRRSHG